MIGDGVFKSAFRHMWEKSKTEKKPEIKASGELFYCVLDRYTDKLVLRLFWCYW